ncbi:MAG: PhoH family protein [Saccharofermentans sp.]|nr:PhoH family protein [Saccharofermentans sp.]
MTETITVSGNGAVNIAGYLSKIADSFKISADTDGDMIMLSGDSSLDIHRSKTVISALLASSETEDISPFMVDYLVALARQGKIDEFMNVKDEIFYITPTGNKITARTLGQKFYIDALERYPLVLASGPAGCGKTFLGVACAVKALKSRQVSRIILTRPAIEAGERLGFLPGDIEEKVDPYMRPIYDALQILLGREGFDRYYEKGIIEVSPLAFMRGRNLDDSFVLLDEAQNTTPEQMKMFLTRLGINCKACVAGDFTQVDLPKGGISGLRDAIRILRGVDDIAIVEMDNSDIVRNSLVKKIVEAYDRDDTKRE